VLATVGVAALSAGAMTTTVAPAPAAATSLGIVTAMFAAPLGAAATPDLVVGPISCPAVGSCVAAGSYTTASRGSAIAVETLAAGVWTASGLAPPSPVTGSYGVGATSVACASVGNCLVAGDYRTAGAKWLHYAIAEVGGTWRSAVQLPAPSSADASANFDFVQSASCAPRAASCEILGNGENAATKLSMSWVTDFVLASGVSGAPVTTTDGSNGVTFQDLSCASASSCTAVGFVSGDFPLAATFSAGAWASFTLLGTPALRGEHGGLLDSVRCVSTTDCVAAGVFSSAIPVCCSNLTAVWTLRAGTWDRGQQVADAGSSDVTSTSDYLTPSALSCAGTVDSCVLLATTTVFANQSVVAQTTNGQWGQVVRGPAPPSAGVPWLLGFVSCASPSACVATGTHTPPHTLSTYGAVAWSTAGSPPSAPSAPRLVRSQATSVLLSWSAPPGGADHYLVRGADVGGSNQILGLATTGVGAAVNLAQGRTYRLSVQAVAADGQASAVSAPLVVTTGFLASAPNLHGVTPRPHGATARWTVPSSLGGHPVTSYVVRVAGGHAIRVLGVAGTARAVRIGGLVAGTRYALRIAAVTSMGVGAWSGALTFLVPR